MEHYQSLSLGRSQWNTSSLVPLEGRSGTQSVTFPGEIAVEHLQSRSFGRSQWNTTGLVPLGGRSGTLVP